jgi:hypothetical protein
MAAPSQPLPASSFPLPFKNGIKTPPDVSPVPAIYFDIKYRCFKTSENLSAFLVQDLVVSRLTDVESYLWLAGRRMAARPLHRQLMMNRDVVVTEQTDLHLCWSGSRIYIKPLPLYLLDAQVWRVHICTHPELYENAMGFLLSYVWLIPNESDFQLATDDSRHPRLLPSSITFMQWTRFLEEFLHDIDLQNINYINPRYRYGELRLGRLNMIYRLAWKLRFKHFMRGYLYGYHDYGTFLQRNFDWLVVVFAYVAIVLTAMQVGLATEHLAQSTMFQEASWGFAVFSIVLPVAGVGSALLIFIILFINNFLATMLHLRRTRGKHTAI